MSWDAVVFATQRVDVPGAADELAVSVVEHAGGCTVQRRVRGRAEVAFTIDGPLRIEREDLPDVVASAGVGLRVSYSLSVPAGASGAVRRLAARLARSMAAAGDGVAYDPQEDRIAWPRGSRRRARLPAAERLSVLQLQWFFPDATAEGALGALFDVADAWWPEARPRRFGDFEPLQHRWDEGGLAGLLALARRGWGTVFWTATRPFFGGAARLLQRPTGTHAHAASPATGEARVASASLTLDARVLDQPGWRDDLVEGFTSAADRMGCVFAQVQVERDWGHGGGRLWADARTQTFRVQACAPDGTWRGLPSDPAWLAWLGPPYRFLDVGLPSGGGALVVAGDTAAASPQPPMAPLDVPPQWRTRGQRRAERVPGGL